MQAIDAYQGVLTLGLFALVALVLLIVLRRPRDAGAEELRRAENERDELRDALMAERVRSGRLETERDSLAGSLAALREELRAEGAKLAERDRELSALKVAERGLAAERDTLQAECGKLTTAHASLEDRLREQVETVKAREVEIAGLKGDLQELAATLKAEREKHAALIDETEKNRAQFVAQFKAISGEILQTQGRAATEAQKGELEKIINPFKAEIEGLKTNLKDISDKAEKERQTLGNQLHLMQARAAELAEEANGLARALRGDRKKQGNWGETILGRILEAAGLIEGTHFDRQAATTDENGNRLIPDIVLRLPGERDVVIDSKVTLVAYQDMVQADDREAEAAALKRHVQAVRAHVRSLSDKRYDGAGSFGSVMMFLPVEGALTAALAADPDLVVEAAEKRVHLMTPTTLMPILKIVDHLWTIDSRNRNVEDIVDRAGKLHDKFASVVEAVQNIGRHLRKATDAQEAAVSRISDGPGNVLRQVDQLRQLGARARKALPAELLAASEVDDSPALPAGASPPRLTDRSGGADDREDGEDRREPAAATQST